MQNQVIADIEIEDQKIKYYSSVVIRQAFNAHHEFAIRIKYDVLEDTSSFSLTNAQKMIGKSVVIKLSNADTMEAAYEFRGIVCEICMEQSDNFTSDLVLKGYSPTILLENGPNLLSFYKKNLKEIVQKITQSLSQSNCAAKLAPKYTAPITYICQYRESTFHFINRLSSDFGEWFYYDGKDLFFGKPSSTPNIDITYGEDVHDIQITLRILPMNFSSYSYVSKDDKVLTSNAPSGVDGLDEYASFALNESNKIFSEPVNFPSRQRVDNKSDLDAFLKNQKSAMASNLEVLTGSSDNPGLCIGAVASVKFSKLQGSSFIKEDYGKFLITSIEHHVTENGKYYNTFEAIPSGMEIIPVKNVVMPVAEAQIATVKDNKDPDNMGRVRVEMLWQQPINEMTDWLRVSTPDAGGPSNRGYVFIPEVDDQVLVCFRYNDADRPFVMGSLFNGKTGAGGGDNNKSKILNTRSGVSINIDDEKGSFNVADAKGNAINIDGAGNISISSSATISLKSGSIFLSAKEDIVLDAKNILLSGKEDVVLNATKDLSVSGTENAIVGSDSKVSIASTKGSVEIQGKSKVVLLSTGPLELQGGPTASLKGGTVQIN